MTAYAPETDHPTVLVTGESLAEEGVAKIEAAGLKLVYCPSDASSADIAERARQNRIQGLVVRHGQIDESVITASDDLRVIANHGAGYDNIDTEAATRHGIPLFAAVGRNATAVAEHALLMMLALSKHLLHFDQATRAGQWRGGVGQPTELRDKTLGIVGFGAIGRALQRAVSGLSIRTLVFDPQISDGEAADFQRVDDLPALLEESDFVSLHVPYVPRTHHLIDASAIARMKPGSVLINTARGEVVDETALFDALQSGHLAGAGLDTFEDEPLGAGNRFQELENVVMTPHVAGVTEECVERLSMACAENLLSVLSDHPLNPGDLVNPETVPGARR